MKLDYNLMIKLSKVLHYFRTVNKLNYALKYSNVYRGKHFSEILETKPLANSVTVN